MNTSLLLIFCIFSIELNSEKLENYRRSCATSKVYIKNEHFWSTPPSIINKKLVIKNGLSEEDWEKAVQYECEEKRTKSNQNVERSASVSENEKYRSSILLMDHMKEMWKEESFRSQVVKNYPTVSNESIPEEIVKILLASSAPNFTIGCSGNTMNVKFYMISIEKVSVWKCEDIGQDVNGCYEYYNILPFWMFKKSDNQTYFIEERFCVNVPVSASSTPTQLPKNVLLCSHKSVKTTDCHTNKIDKCVKEKKTPDSSFLHFYRQLPGGVAIYGSFTNQADHSDGDSNPEIVRVDPGLYYFSYDHIDS